MDFAGVGKVFKMIGSQKGASAISLLVAVSIVSIAFVAYYKVMWHIQKAEHPQLEKVRIQQKLITYSEILQFQIAEKINEAEELRWEELLFFETLEYEYTADGIKWFEVGKAKQIYTWELIQLESPWVRLKVFESARLGMNHQVVWSLDALR
jgi:hypothetical protein